MNEKLGYNVDSSALAKAARDMDLSGKRADSDQAKREAVGWDQSRMLNGQYVPFGGPAPRGEND